MELGNRSQATLLPDIGNTIFIARSVLSVQKDDVSFGRLKKRHSLGNKLPAPNRGWMVARKNAVVAAMGNGQQQYGLAIVILIVKKTGRLYVRGF